MVNESVTLGDSELDAARLSRFAAFTNAIAATSLDAEMFG